MYKCAFEVTLKCSEALFNRKSISDITNYIHTLFSTTEPITTTYFCSEIVSVSQFSTLPATAAALLSFVSVFFNARPI